MPIIGLLLGHVDFSDLFISLSGQHVSSFKEALDKGMPVIGYGVLINTIIEFLIYSFVLFLVIKQMNRLRGRLNRLIQLHLPKKSCWARFATF